MPVFDALRPEGPRQEGFCHAGPVGAGHYAKMVHNGIEYAIMQAFAEGYELLSASDAVDDVPAIFEGWRRGTVVRSWLLDLMVAALEDDPHLAKVSGYAEDSGEGRWTVMEGIAERGAHADDRRLAVRPVRLAPGGQPGHEGDRRPAQPVRRARRPDKATPAEPDREPAWQRRRAVSPCTSSTCR